MASVSIYDKTIFTGSRKSNKAIVAGAAQGEKCYNRTEERRGQVM